MSSDNDKRPVATKKTATDSPAQNAADVIAQNPNLENIVLALLFASEEPVSVRRMVSIVEDADADSIHACIEGISARFAEENWSIQVERIAGGYQISSRPEYATWISRLYTGRRKFRLSRAAMETLAVIAYKQPATRAEIENVRGVSCGGVIGNLMERSLVRITGKARVLGAPFLYGTTAEFLEYLGLNSLSDLPNLDELEKLLEKEAYPDAVDASTEGDAEGDAETDGAPEEHAGGGAATVADDEDEGVFDFAGAVEALDRVARAAAESTATRAETTAEGPGATAPDAGETGTEQAIAVDTNTPDGGMDESQGASLQAEADAVAAPAEETEAPGDGTPVPTIDFTETRRSGNGDRGASDREGEK